MNKEYEAPKRYTATNDSTGDLIKSRADSQDKYAAGWDLIFAAKEVKDISVAAFNEVMDKESCLNSCKDCGCH